VIAQAVPDGSQLVGAAEEIEALWRGYLHETAEQRARLARR
jgi:hypothetical protein